VLDFGNLGVLDLFSISCVYRDDFHDKLVFETVGPSIFVGEILFILSSAVVAA
jgi:hypothetical protein